MPHTYLISAHAASGITAFALGDLGLRPPTLEVLPTFRAYLGALWATVVFLIRT